MENGQATGKKSLGEILVEANLITSQQWEEAQQAHLQRGMSPEEYLQERGYVSAQTLALYTSLYLDVPFVNLNRQQVYSDALDLVPQNIARKYNLIPLKVQDGTLTVAMQDPQDLEALEDLAEQLGIDPMGLVQTVREFNSAIQEGTLDPGPFNMDHKHTDGLEYNKTNYSISVEEPPFEGYVVTGGMTFTWGGLKVDDILSGQLHREIRQASLFAPADEAAKLFTVSTQRGKGFFLSPARDKILLGQSDQGYLTFVHGLPSKSSCLH